MVNYILSVFLFLQAGLSVILAIIIYRKSPENKVNQVFTFTFLSWTFFFGLEAVWQLSDKSIGTVLANLLRDVSLTGGILATMGVLLGIWFIIKGTEEKDLRFYIPLITISIIGIIFGNLLDYIAFSDLEGKWVIQTDVFGQIIAYGSPALFLLISCVFLFQTLKELQDPILKKKITILLVGIIVSILAIPAIIIFDLLGITSLPISLGEILLLVGEILIFWSFR